MAKLLLQVIIILKNIFFPHCNNQQFSPQILKQKQHINIFKCDLNGKALTDNDRICCSAYNLWLFKFI